VTVTLNLKPEIEAGLLAQAQATGVSLENYLQQLVEKQLSSDPSEAKPSAESGMVWENGLFVYRTGKSLPSVLGQKFCTMNCGFLRIVQSPASDLRCSRWPSEGGAFVLLGLRALWPFQSAASSFGR
jgi:hypothetical protein